MTGWFPSEGTSFSSPFVYYQVLELSKFFDEVHVISMQPQVPKMFRKKKILEALGMKNRWHKDIYSEHYAEDYRMGNISVHYVKYLLPPNSVFRGIFWRRAVSKIRSLISREKLEFSLIHAHFLWPSGYVAAHLKKYYGVPVVVTGHGSDVYVLPFKNASWRKRIEYSLRMADSIITVGKKNRDIMVSKLGVPEEKVSVIPNGYSSEIFAPMDMAEARKALNIPPDRKVLLTAGNLLPVKGHRYLIEAIDLVRKRRKDVLCIIVGSGPLETELREQIRALGLEDHIWLVGGRPYDEMPVWMNACDVFVLPSLNEGNPTVMFETIGCGKPFVGTTVGGVPEAISDDRIGLLVPPADSTALAVAILKALEMDWDQAYIRNYAEKYTTSSVAKEIFLLYEKLWKNKGR